jgi:hypothetical protein
MRIVDIIFLVLLFILIDREYILRNRYKIAIECNRPNKYRRGYFAIWIYCREAQKDFYTTYGGKRLVYFYYGKKKPGGYQ